MAADMAMAVTACTVAMATIMAVTGVTVTAASADMASTSAEAAGARCGPISGRVASMSAIGCSEPPTDIAWIWKASADGWGLSFIAPRVGFHQTVQILAAFEERFDENPLIAAMRAIFCDVA